MTTLFDTFAVLAPSLGVDTLPVGPDVYERLDREYDAFAGHVLVSAHAFDGDWGVWEQHPHGDELVVLLSGAAELVLSREGEEHVTRLDAPGAFVVVPRGVWHTARTSEPTRMLFVTPGEGTRNESEPG